MDAPPQDSGPPPRIGGTSRRTRVAALIIACALFMQNLDSTIIATALPNMAKAFGEDPVHMNVALTSYLLALAVFIPASGWVADRYGARPVFRAAIAVFTIGSILCGRADSLSFLVLARVIQGLGGAMMVPVGRLVLLRTVPKHEMVAAMSWLSMPAMLGPVVGPPLGGFIVTWFSWRWIFDLNVPIGILGVVLVTLFIEDSKGPEPPPFDFWGLLWSGACLAALLVGFETLGRGIVPPLLTYAMLVFGAGSGVAYWLHARGMARPLLDLSLLQQRTFAVGCSAGTLFRFGVGALPFLLPLMLQLDFGYSPERSGLTTFATAAGSLAVKPLATTVLRRFGFRTTLLWNGVLGAVSMAACAAFRPGWPVWLMFLILLIGGVFRSLQFSAFNTVVYSNVPRSRLSSATSLYSTVQQLSMTVGITVGAASLEVARAFSHHEVPTLDDFSAAFLVVSALALSAAPIATSLTHDAGSDLTGHRLRQVPGREKIEVEAAGE